MQLAGKATELMAAKRKREAEAPPPTARRMYPLPPARQPASEGDDDKRMRRPTAIMRANVEVAHYTWACPARGSRQRHLSADEVEADRAAAAAPDVDAAAKAGAARASRRRRRRRTAAAVGGHHRPGELAARREWRRRGVARAGAAGGRTDP